MNMNPSPEDLRFEISDISDSRLPRACGRPLAAGSGLIAARAALRLCLLFTLGAFTQPVVSLAAGFDAAPFALPLTEGNGLLWEDPREVHRVVVSFQGSAPALDKVRLEYWGKIGR